MPDSEFLALTSFAKKPAHLLNPLRVMGVQDAVDEAFMDVSRALKFAKATADPVFLAVPQGMAAEEALRAGTRWTFHYDTGAGAVAHLNRARKALKGFRTPKAVDSVQIEKAEMFGEKYVGFSVFLGGKVPNNEQCLKNPQTSEFL